VRKQITAAPQLLEKFNLENTIVSVDAIMTQKEIAAKIIERGGCNGLIREISLKMCNFIFQPFLKA
jgi:predicted transposase YbfD/YdcC